MWYLVCTACNTYNVVCSVSCISVSRYLSLGVINLLKENALCWTKTSQLSLNVEHRALKFIFWKYLLNGEVQFIRYTVQTFFEKYKKLKS